MWRVEIVEITSYCGDIARISSPAKNEEDIIKLVKEFKEEYEEELKREEYYIKILYVNIIEEE